MTTLGRRHVLRAGGAALAVTALGGISACSGSADGPTSTPTPIPEPPVMNAPPLPALSLRTVSGVTGKPLTKITTVEIAGDIALLKGSGGDDSTVGDLVAMRLTDGKILWTHRDLDDPLDRRVDGALPFSSTPLVGGVGSRAVYPFQYYRSPCPDNADLCRADTADSTAERGVAAASVTSGGVAWIQVVVPRVSGDRARVERDKRLTMVIVAADATRVIVNDGPSAVLLGGAALTSGQQTAVTALDPRTGRRLWRVEGVLAESLTGNLIQARIPDRSGNDYAPTTLVSLDTATGQRRWTSRAPGRWVAGVERMAAVALTTPGTKQLPLSLIDPSTGDVLHRLPDTVSSVVIGTAVDGTPLAVWSSNGTQRRLWSIALGESTLAVGAESLPDTVGLVNARVRGGGIWTTDSTPAQVVAYDRSGRPASPTLPGSLLAITDDWLVTDRSRGTIRRAGIDVHAVA